MKQKIKPVILLGLGKHGSEIANSVYTVLSEKQKDLTKIISYLILEENGDFRDIKNESAFKCEGLKPKLSLENFRPNFQVLQNHEKKFEDILADKIENVRRREIIIELQEKGYEIEETIGLFLISTLFDPIGSTAIIPFLGFIQYILTGRLRGTIIETNLLGFFPDLFEEYKKNELAYSRSYACLQELDFIANHPKLISSEEQSLLNFTYLFTGKNEEAVEIGSYKELTPMLGEILFSLLTGEIASDVSFSTVLSKRIDSKATRYSSFGLAKLIFPIDKIMKGFSDYLIFSILESEGVITPKTFERGYIGADVKGFLLENKFDRISEELELDTEGKTIWVDFKYKGTINENVVIENFINDIEEETGNFDKDEVTAMNRKLSLRREQLSGEKTRKLLRAIKAGIDSKENGIFYSKAFLDVLQNQKSPYTKGDIVEKAFTLDLIEKEVKAFFDEAFGINREGLGKLKRDIDDKTSLLEKSKKKLRKKETKGEERAKEDLQETEDLAIEKDSLAPKKEQAEKGLKKRVEVLETEIEDLKEQYSELEDEIADFDFKISDPSERRKLLGDIEKKTEEEIEKVRTDLHEIDKRYREEKHKLDELYEERKRIVRKLLIISPVAGTAVFLIILYAISRIPNLSLLKVLKIGGNIYPFGLVGYGIWGFLKYWNGIRRKIQEAILRVTSLKNEKINLLLRYQELYNRIFKTRFKHSLHGGLLEWIKDYKDFVVKTENETQAFIDKLVQSSKEKKEALENIAFPSTLFVRSVVTKKDLGRFIEENVRLSIETERFFKEKSLSKYFDEFREIGDLNSLFSAIDDFSEGVFKPVREKSIEEFMEEEESEGRINTAEKLINLYDSAKAFVLLDVEKGMDKSSDIVYLGVENPETSYAKEILRKQGHTDAQPYSIRNKYEIAISKLKVGFPAFHIALIKYGKKLISKIKDREKLYINSEWELEDLLPSVYTLGDEEDEMRINACLGRAFGLIEEKEKKFYFQNKEIGSSYQEVVELIKSFKGSSIRNKLSNFIEEEKQKEDAIDRLFAYKNSKKLDEIDTRIIESVLDELNPLA